jgi:alpha-1,6-mannosyltransferase
MPYLIPGAGFVAMYSCLGHKEMRFLFPVMPLVNLAAAVGITKIHQWAFPAKKKRSTLISRLAYLGCIGCLLGTLLGSLLFLEISRHNYPGGEALIKLSNHLRETRESKEAIVWVDVASAMSGVSLFGQRTASELYPMTIDKGGYEDENSAVMLAKYSHILSEESGVDGFHTVTVAEGNPRFDLGRLRVVSEPTIYVLEKDDWRQSVL